MLAIVDRKRGREENIADSETANGVDADHGSGDKRAKIESPINTNSSAPRSHASDPAASANAAPSTAAQAKPKKRRWDEGKAATPSSSSSSSSSSAVNHLLLSLLNTSSRPTPIPVPIPSMPTPTPTSISTPTLSPEEVEKARLEARIRQKMAQLNLPIPTSSSLFPSSTVPSSTLHPPPAPTVKGESDSSQKQWKPLRLDSSGREVDESGNVISIKREATLLINQKSEEDKDDKNAAAAAATATGPLSKKIKIQNLSQPSSSLSSSALAPPSYFDPRMPESKGERMSRPMLNFVKPGKYIAKAATMRMKQLERAMRVTRYEAMVKEGKERERLLSRDEEGVEHVPMIEWWDTAVFTVQQVQGHKMEGMEGELSIGEQQQQQQTVWNIEESKITHYIHHPLPIAPLAVAPLPPPPPIMLTKRERKKIKRREKMALQKEEQEKIRLGLAPPPPPKLRISNLMNALKNESVADPSLMEARVRAEIRERKEKHERDNLMNTKTKEEKDEKRRLKMKEDLSGGVHVAVYRAGDLSHPHSRYKLDINSQQWNLSGVGIMISDSTHLQLGEGADSERKKREMGSRFNMVVVEGGPKGMKRMKQLMCGRMSWLTKEEGEKIKAKAELENDPVRQADLAIEEEEEEEEDDNESDDDDDEDDEQEGKSRRRKKGSDRCVCVWEGIVATPAFQTFSFEVCRSELQARNFLAKHGVPHYWDLARSYEPPR